MVQLAITFTRQEEMHDQACIPSSSTEGDALIAIQATAGSVESHDGERIKVALLEAVDMIRRLRVLMDSGTEITTKQQRRAVPRLGCRLRSTTDR